MGDSLLRVALRWLAHPVSLGAIVVMALNDHMLKQVYGTWWTGKLSDVAGLVFFPALVAVAFAAVLAVLGRARMAPDGFVRLVLASVTLTGIGFVWVKATWVGAATASAVLSALAGPLFDGPSVVRADATDLLALPALGVAVWAGIGVAQSQGAARGTLGVRRTGRTRRALTVVAVPIALLASVATGVSENSHARVVTDDAGAWRGQVKDAYNYGGDAYYTRTGAGWELFYEDDAIAPTTGVERPAVLPDREQTEDCVPSDPTVCFRVMTGATGVEASADGGATWDVDWQLTPDQVTTLERVYGEPAKDFATHGVGVVEVADGYVVVAGNGTDGFAVRGIDGEWERVGFAGMDCCKWLKTADFGTVEELPVVHAYPVGLPMGLGLATLALPFLATALLRGSRTRLSWVASGAAVVSYLLGAMVGILVVALNYSYAPVTRDDPGLDALTFVPMGGLAIGAVLGAVGMFGLFRRGAFQATFLGWAAGAVVAGAASGATARSGVGSPWWQAGVGVVALAALYAVYVPWARWRLVRFGVRGPSWPAPTGPRYADPPHPGPGYEVPLPPVPPRDGKGLRDARRRD